MHEMKFLLVLVLSVPFLLAGCGFGGTQDTDGDKADVGEGTPEACGNGICDSVEAEKGLCAQDCNGESGAVEEEDENTEAEAQSTAISEQEGEELLETTMAAYEKIESILDELEEAVDAGSQGQVDALIREIDSIAQETEVNGIKPLFGTGQEILSAADGYRSAGSPWPRIKDVVSALVEGNQRVEFTYSFIIDGTQMENGESLELKDQQDGSVSHQAFTQEISHALAAWEAVFEQVFNTSHGYGGNLEIVFTNLGDEAGTSFGSNKEQSTYEIPGDENIGDFRYGMETYENLVTGTPFSPMTSVEDGYGEASGDVHFNSAINWRTDGDSAANATSVMIVAAHETGHGLAFQHEDDGLMSPPNIVRGTFDEFFPDGLKDDSAVVAAMVAMYGGGATITSRSVMVEDGSTLSLPAVNAATLGVSAIKVGTVEEAKTAAILVKTAQLLLQDFKQELQ